MAVMVERWPREFFPNKTTWWFLFFGLQTGMTIIIMIQNQGNQYIFKPITANVHITINIARALWYNPFHVVITETPLKKSTRSLLLRPSFRRFAQILDRRRSVLLVVGIVLPSFPSPFPPPIFCIIARPISTEQQTWRIRPQAADKAPHCLAYDVVIANICELSTNGLAQVVNRCRPVFGGLFAQNIDQDTWKIQAKTKVSRVIMLKAEMIAPTKTNSTGANRFPIFVKPSFNSSLVAMFQNSRRTSSISSLNWSPGLSMRLIHFSIFCAVGICSSGRPSQQYTKCAMHWKSRPRLVSHSRTCDSPPSTATCRASSSDIQLSRELFGSSGQKERVVKLTRPMATISLVVSLFQIN